MGSDRSYVQLHAHSSSSFDSRADPCRMVDRAVDLGFTHLAITDHDRIEGVLRARDYAGDRIRIIVGQEITSPDGDLVGLFVERVIPPGLSAKDAAAAVHEQGGLVGLPHPFDSLRSSGGSRAGGAEEVLEQMAGIVDYVEAHNARAYRDANPKATSFAEAHGLPGVAVSDAHSLRELGVAGTVLPGDFSSASELLELLPRAELMTGRAPYYVRLWTPVARVLNRALELVPRSRTAQ
jgi:predicted metal-dependent phosphoesterase TrpH